MDEFEKIRKVVETNFRLNSLHIRDLGAQLGADLKQSREETKMMSAQLREVVKQNDRLADRFGRMGEQIAEGFEQQAQRNDEVVAAFNSMGEGRVELRKEIEELKLRIAALEERAS